MLEKVRKQYFKMSSAEIITQHASQTLINLFIHATVQGSHCSHTDSNITKTFLYSFDPLEPHFYKVKLRFSGVYINFLISAQTYRLWVLVTNKYFLLKHIDCGYSLLTSTHNICFKQKYENYQNFSSENFHFLVVKFSI